MCMAQSTKGQTGELLHSLCDEVWAAVLHIDVVRMLPANGGGRTETHKTSPVGSRRKENNSFAGAVASAAHTDCLPSFRTPLCKP